MTTLVDLKQVHRATWAAGDYAAVAEHIDTVPPDDLLGRITITPGQDVVDRLQQLEPMLLQLIAERFQPRGLQARQSRSE